MALSPNDLAKLAYGAGFRGSALRMAVAVALAESSGNPNAYNPEVAAGTRPGHGSRGLWQIYGTAHPWADNDQFFNPSLNAQAAFRVYREAGNSFRPWSTFNNGSAHRISQSLQLDMPTGEIVSVAPAAIAGATATGSGVGGPQALAGASGVASGIAGSALTGGGGPLVSVSLLPEGVNQALSNIAKDPEGVKKTMAVGLIGLLFVWIGASILFKIMIAPAGEAAGAVAKQAGTAALAAAL